MTASRQKPVETNISTGMKMSIARIVKINARETKKVFKARIETAISRIKERAADENKDKT